MNKIKKTIKTNPFYLIVSKPGIYLKVLLWRTCIIGLFTLIMGLLVKYFNLDKSTIPPTMHSLIGIVIGLLLVFRTNTAYDRWWDGRKIIGNLSTQIGLITARLGTMKSYELNFYPDSNFDTTNKFKRIVKKFMLSLHDYLVNSDDNEESSVFHIKQNKIIEEAFIELNNFDQTNQNIGHINNSLNLLLEYSNNLERIKNTPIPLAYVLHIKMSILIYLLTLPFGMFHEMGLWATPLVMLVYYIIAGVEIISSEIENPFADDPNDLPTSELFKDMLDALKDNEKKVVSTKIKL
jgi:putative membrane protein